MKLLTCVYCELKYQVEPSGSKVCSKCRVSFKMYLKQFDIIHRDMYHKVNPTLPNSVRHTSKWTRHNAKAAIFNNEIVLHD